MKKKSENSKVETETNNIIEYMYTTIAFGLKIGDRESMGKKVEVAFLILKHLNFGSE